MKAILVQHNGEGIPKLVAAEIPAPKPAAGQLLVRVMTAGLNRADISLSSDHYTAGSVAGSEFAGVVEQLGPDTTNFAVGDRIMALAKEALAEYAIVDADLAVKLPEGFGWEVAAAIPAWYMTAYDALWTQGAFAPEDSILIQGATSGVGQAAAQLAKASGAKCVIGVARSAAKLAVMGQGEISQAIVSDSNWPDVVSDITGGAGVNIIIDMVGGSALEGNLRSLANCGRMVAVGRLGGSGGCLDLNILAFKRARIIGTSFRSRSKSEKAEVVRAFCRSALPLIFDGKVRPRLDQSFSLNEIGNAHNFIRENRHFGKVIIKIHEQYPFA